MLYNPDIVTLIRNYKATMITIKFNVKQLIRRLELQKNRDYQIQEIAELSGINRFTLSGIIGNNNTRIDLATISKLLNFFLSEGMLITVNELFEVSEIES